MTTKRKLGFACVTVIFGLLLVWGGSQLSWIHQRHQFLEEQMARQVAAWPGQTENPAYLRFIKVLKSKQASDEIAPGLLWLFGEHAVGELLLLIPKEETIVERELHWTWMSPLQKDYRRARALFPEAKLFGMEHDEFIPQDGRSRGIRRVYALGEQTPPSWTGTGTPPDDVR